MGRIKDYKVIIAIAMCILSITYIIYLMVSGVYVKANAKVRKIKKNQDKSVGYKKENILVQVINVISNRFKPGRSEKVELKLIRAGDPLSRIGINHKNYNAIKIILSVLFGLTIGMKTKGVFGIIYGAGVYFTIEMYVSKQKNNRRRKVRDELDTLVSYSINLLEQGFGLNEIFGDLSNIINPNNPLYKELLMISIKSNSNTVNNNFSKMLDELQKRIGMEEIDNYCLALKNYEEAGKAVRMLKKQLELIRSEGNLKKRRETLSRGNVNGIAMSLAIACMIIVMIVPMITLMMENPMFQK